MTENFKHDVSNEGFSQLETMTDCDLGTRLFLFHSQC
uniref:Uncharacterized protein n=1 Tax=Trichinella nativa TaxID=6335 RepID=A0A0V1KHD4_9BILA